MIMQRHSQNWLQLFDTTKCEDQVQLTFQQHSILAAFSSIDHVKYGNDKILATIVKDVKEHERGVDC